MTATKSKDEILRAEGYDPAEFELVEARQWGKPDDPQFWVKAVPKKPNGIEAARKPGDYSRSRRPVKTLKTKPRTAAFISDQHAPFHDERLHDLTLEWLRLHKPSQVVLGGDLVEFDTISRHRKTPQDAAVQRGLNVAYGLLLDYVQAVPTASFSLLPGNHDVRLQHYLLDRAPEVFGLHKGARSEEAIPAAYSLESLLRCDELGIDYIDGSYENAQVAISPQLVARHGWKAHKGAGKTAIAHMADVGMSIVHGHVHRQAIVNRTIYGVDRKAIVQPAVEAGCMCSLELAETYSTNADWQQGFAAFTVWPDGTFAPELVSYSNGKLRYRGKVLS
jgi:hypothetical protein